MNTWKGFWSRQRKAGHVTYKRKLSWPSPDAPGDDQLVASLKEGPADAEAGNHRFAK